MDIKESFQKFIDDKRLEREKKIAKREMCKKYQEFEKENLEDNEETKSKFNFERLKDVGLITVAVMLVGVGYANFSNNSADEETIQTSSSNLTETNSLGDVQLVSSEAGIVENDDEEDGEEVQNTVVENEEETENTVTTSSDSSSYFAELKLNRDNIYSQKLETYQQMIDSTSISSEQKSIAIQEIEKITETQNQIAVAEELIKLKGFENVVIYVNDNSVSVIVRSATLSSEQVAQIQNIVTRELGVETSNINISTK